MSIGNIAATSPDHTPAPPRRRRRTLLSVAMAIGFIILALVLAGVFSGSHKDVASDLQHALTTRDNVVLQGKPACVHETGNIYTCRIKTRGVTILGRVVDDGHNISWTPGSATRR